MRNNRAVLLLLLANSISGVSQGISMLAIPWYFSSIIHRETLFGQLYFLLTVVSLFWGVYAGTLIDKYDRRKIFLAMNLVGLFVLTSVSAYGYYFAQAGWIPVALAFGTTLFIYNIHFPNIYAFSQEITPPEYYAKVTSLIEIQGQMTWTISGGLAAILLNGVDGNINFFGFTVPVAIHIRAWKIHEIFTIDAITYLIAWVIISRIRSLPMQVRIPDTTPLIDRMKSGFIYLKHHAAVLRFGIASTAVFMTINVSGMYLMPIYVDRFLRAGANVFALNDMSFSMGALLAGFVTTKIFGQKEQVRPIIALSLLAGLMYAFQTQNRILFLFFFTQFIIGWANAAIRIQRVTYLFNHIPNHLIGRTNSIFFVANVAMRLVLLGLFTLPFFHAGTNIIYAVAVMMLVCFTGALILLFRSHQLMHPDEKPAAAA